MMVNWFLIPKSHYFLIVISLKSCDESHDYHIFQAVRGA
jgi:hypothetical protein